MRDRVLEVTNVSKKYPNQNQNALQPINMTVHRGECLALLGPNGAGKSTLIGILKTRLSSDMGSFTVDAADASKVPARVRRRIAYVPQMDDLDEGLTVLDSLIFHGRYFGMSLRAARTSARATMKTLGISEIASQRTNLLSGGQRQRVLWARALTHKPSLLVLDEPSTGLDLYGKQDTYDLVRQAKHLNVGVLLTTHDMSEAVALADRVMIMNRGEIVAEGAPRELGPLLGVGDEVAILQIETKGEGGNGVRSVLSEICCIEGVVKVDERDIERSLFAIHMSGETDAITQTILDRVSAADASVLSLERRAIQLTDVFFEVTSK